MQDDSITQSIAIENGVLFLSGYGVRVSVDSRHLRVSDGIGRRRHSGAFAKATCRLKRLVVLAQTGFVTLPALKWLSDIGAAFVQLDYEGRVVTMSTQGLDNAMMRRAQAFGTVGEHRASLAATLLRPKVQAQFAVLEAFGLGDPHARSLCIAAAERANTFDEILQAERQAALAYWTSWAGVEMTFARRDAVPEHWRRFGTRRSPLTLAPRNASSPINAILNYLYTLLEIEARIALHLRGLDTGLGLFHADAANRQSFAADVMEPARPHVDTFVLRTLRSRVFRAKDFVETREGGCRLSSDLARQLASTMPTWAKLVAPYAELVSRDLIASSKQTYLGPLVEARPQKRSVHKGRLRVRTEPIALPKIEPSVCAIVKNGCRTCGVVLRDTDRKFCDECLGEQRQAHGRKHLVEGANNGRAVLARLAAQGRDPRRTPAVRKKRAAKASANRCAVTRWTDDGALKDVDFKRDILLGLQALPLSRISKALNCCDSYSSKIRRGAFTPHKRHWNTLRDLGTEAAQ